MNDVTPGSPLIRAALIVRDLERSRRFYADLLGQPPGTLCRFQVLKQAGPCFG